MIAADYCSLKGKTWLIMVDRFTGWNSIYYFQQDALAKKLVETRRETFIMFGVPCEISTDCGTQYMSHEFTAFLRQWRISLRKSAEYNPHSNPRAETAVKSAKRILSAHYGIRSAKLGFSIVTLQSLISSCHQPSYCLADQSEITYQLNPAYLTPLKSG